MDGKSWDEPVGADLIMQLQDVKEMLRRREDPVNGRSMMVM